MSKVWDVKLRKFCQTLDKHSRSVSSHAFYQDWILVSGSTDGTVQMFDLSVEGSGDASTFMNKKNFFTIVQKEKHIEESNSVVALTVSSNGLVFVIDKHRNGRVYSVFHGQKLFKATPAIHFSLESLTGSKPSVSQFQVSPRPLFTVNNSRLYSSRHALREMSEGRVGQ